jgi:transposase InsO family protein
MSGCAKVVGISVRTLERWQRVGGGEDGRHGPNTVPANKLTAQEEKRLLELLNKPEYRNKSPRQIIPMLAEQDIYIASEATAYRLLKKHKQLNHRENKRPRRHRKPKELVACGPNQVFCWDITYLKSPVSGMFYYLYMVTDIYSHRVVAAEVYDAENDQRAAELFARLLDAEGIEPGQLWLHADNGNAMKGYTLKAMMDKRGVFLSYSRPHVSDDNAFAESLFSTMKGRSNYPTGPFRSLAEAQAWVDRFVAWYNGEHRHSALNWVTPNARHTGADLALLRQRKATLERARKQHPNRWSGPVRNCDPAPPVVLNPSKARLAADAAAKAA